jgi:predicted nucleic acid-binding protein
MLLIDTDVLIEAFNDKKFVELIKPFSPTVCTVVNIEAIQGSKSKQEVKKIEKFISDNFERFSNTAEDLEKALELVRRYSSSSGILLGDAIIGATAINRNLPLFTFNQRHFRYHEIKPLLFRL